MKKMNGFDFFRCIGILLCSAVVVLTFTTCDFQIGLGPSVDTVSPTATIIRPSDSQYINGGVDFAVEGTFWDDRKIGHLSIVRLENSDYPEKCSYSQKDLEDVAITLDDKGNGGREGDWNIPFKYDSDGYYIIGDGDTAKRIYLADGHYIIDIKAYDQSERQSPLVSRSFVIDNTPPVFMVSSPSSLENHGDFSSFGQIVAIRGAISDTSSIKEMKINKVLRVGDGLAIQEDITDKIKPTTKFINPDKSNTYIEIARYFTVDDEYLSDDDKILKSNYLALFNKDTPWTDSDIKNEPVQKIMLSVSLVDDCGNESVYSYVSGALDKFVKENCHSLDKDTSLDKTDYMKICNGVYDSTIISAEDVQKIKFAMDGRDISTGELADKEVLKNYNFLTYDKGDENHIYLAMDVSPKNSPFYQIGGLEIKKQGATDYSWGSVSPGQTLTIGVTWGRDQIQFVPSSMEVKIYEVTNSSNPMDYNPEPVVVFKKDATKDNEFYMDKDLDGYPNGSLLFVTTGSKNDVYTQDPMVSGDFSLTLPSYHQLMSNRFYKIIVSGKDQNGIGFDNRGDYGYGFRYVTSGTAPTVDIASGKFYKASSVDGSLTHPIVIVDKMNQMETNGGAGVEYTLDYYEGHFATKDAAEYSGVTPKKMGPYSIKDFPVGSNSRYDVDLNLRNLSEAGLSLDKNYTVVITINATNGDVPSNTAYGIVYVDGVAPSLEVSNLKNNSTISAANPYYRCDDEGKSLFEVRGTWSDEDGSGTKSLSYKKSGDAVFTPVESQKSSGWSFNLPVSEGDFDLTLKFEDEIGNVNTCTISNILVDFAAPKLSLKSPETVPQYVNSNTKFIFEALDTHELNDIEIVADLDGNPVDVSSGLITFSAVTPKGRNANGENVYQREVTINAKDDSCGLWEITATAIDTGNQKSQSVVVKNVLMDTVRPVISDSGILVDGKDHSDDAWYSNPNLRIEGNVTETGSKLKNVYFLATTTSDHGVNSNSRLSDLRDSYSNYGESAPSATGFSIIPNTLEINKDGVANAVWIQVEDNAGNFSVAKQVRINIDQNHPVVSSKFYTLDDENFNPANGTVLSNGKKNLIVYGNLTESESGIKDIHIERAGQNVSAALTYSTSTIGDEVRGDFVYKSLGDFVDLTSIKSWRAEISSENAKTSGGIRAIAEDKAGNKSSTTLFSLEIDDIPPVLKLTDPMTTKVFPNPDTLPTSNINGKVTISGTASDGSLDNVKLYWGLDKDDPDFTNDSHMFGNVNGAGAYAWSAELDASNREDGKIYFIDGNEYDGTPKEIYVKVVATDTAGNENSEIYKYNIDPQLDRPVITINSLDLSSMSDSQTAWLKNTTVLRGILMDDDGIKTLRYKFKETDSWQTLGFTNGAWTLDLGAEGEKSVWFEVTDNAGGIFASQDSKSQNQYLCPVLKAGDGYAVESTSVLHITADKSAPEIKAIKYKTENPSDSSINSGEWSEDFGRRVFGGKYSQLRIRIDAEDASGLKKGTFYLDGKTYDLEVHETYFQSEPIDISNMNGNFSATVTIFDKADMKTSKAIGLYVDNEKPSISINVPSGMVSTSASVYGTVSEMGKTYFAVTKEDVDSESITEKGTKGDKIFADKWIPIEDATVSWTVYFDNGNNTDGKTHADLLKYFIDYAGITDGIETVALGKYGQTTKLRFHIMTEDSCLNEARASALVTVDPLGDKPELKISYPSEGAKVGGSVTIMGTAKDNIAANYAWVMIDVNGDGKWDYDDISTIRDTYKANYLTWGHYSPELSGESRFADINPDAIPSGLDEDKYKYYAIRCNVSGISWNLTINSNNNDFVPSSASTANLKIWAYATDGDGNSSPMENASLPSRTFTLDKDSPMIVNQYLVQYTNGVETARQAYDETSDIAIRGEWFYEADIYDDSDIARITVNNESCVDETIIKKNEWFSRTFAGPNIPATAKGFHIKMPVGHTLNEETVLSRSYKINVVENTPSKLNNSVTVALVVDNMKPVIKPQTSSEFKIARDADGRVVTNYDKFYTFGSAATEDSFGGVNQTGVSKVAFYFTRDIESENLHKIYDIFEPRTSDFNNVDKSTLKFNSEDGLYWKTMTVVSGNGSQIVLSDSWGSIHNGGLVKINNVIYTIASAVDNTITMDSGKFDSLSNGDKVDFALAAVVDFAGQESEGNGTDDAGYYNDIPNGDNDRLLESLVKQNTTWTWEASVNSRLIDDGLATLNYVVFDKAGNCVSDSVDVFIGNHQPRIAGMRASTDTNSNGKYDSEETVNAFGTYDKGRDENNRDMTSVTFPLNSTGQNPSSVFAVRNKLRIEPEIVGGNGKLKYTVGLSKLENEKWGASYIAAKPAKDLKDNSDNILEGNDDTSVKGVVEFSVNDQSDPNNMKGWGFEDGKNQRLTVFIEDSAKGRPMKADLSLILDMELDDTLQPVNKIRPFYWKSEKENSLYMNSRDEGHIDLPADLEEILKHKDDVNDNGNTISNFAEVYKTKEGTGKEAPAYNKFFNDLEPKVSGKIKMEGVARDDHILTSLTVNIWGEEKSIATYDVLSGTWTTKKDVRSSLDGDTDVVVWSAEVSDATYEEYVACGYLPKVPNGKSPSAKIAPITQEYGHVVKWTLNLDTEAVCKTVVYPNDTLVYPVAVDFVIRAGAKDRGSPMKDGSYDNPKVLEVKDGKFDAGTSFEKDGKNLQTGGSIGKDAATNCYKFDIVPYITKLETVMSRKNSDGTVYGRTSRGAYPILSTEAINIKGFNLGKITSYIGTDGKTKDFITAYIYGDKRTDGTAVNNGFFHRKKTLAGLNADNPLFYDEASKTFKNIKASNFTDQGMLSFRVAAKYYTKNGTAATAMWIPSFNNDNLNTAPYNLTDNKKNNAQLNDDFKIELWEINNLKTKTGGVNIYRPVVKADPSTGQIGFSASDGTNFQMTGYPNSKGQASGQKKIDNNMLVSNAVFKDGTFTFDENGNTYGLVQSYSSNQVSYAGFFKFTMIEQPKSHNAISGGYWVTQGARLEASSIDMYEVPERMDASKFNLNLTRVQSPAIATRVLDEKDATGNNYVMVYVAYADTSTNQIRFRRGKVSPALYTTTAGTTNDANGLKAGEDAYKAYENGTTKLGSSLRDLQDFDSGFRLDARYTNSYDYTGQNSTASPAAPAGYSYPFVGTPLNNTETSVTNGRYRYPPDSLQTLSGQTIFIVAGAGVTLTNGEPQQWYGKGDFKKVFAGNGFGHYCDIAVSKEGNVAITWCDEQNGGVMKYVVLTEEEIADAEAEVLALRSEESLTEDQYKKRQDKLMELTLDRAKLIQGKTKPVSGNGGTYCKVAFDSDSNLHFAYYRGGLYYAYAKSSSLDSVAKEMCIDSFESGGENLSMTVGKDADGCIKPYFAYYSGGKAKYAYCTEFNKTTNLPLKAGMEKGKYTGAWEVGYVPTTYTVADDNVSVALWVDKYGYIRSFNDINSTKWFDKNGIEQAIAKKGVIPRPYADASIVYSSTDPLVAFVNGQGNLVRAQIIQN